MHRSTSPSEVSFDSNGVDAFEEFHEIKNSKSTFYIFKFSKKHVFSPSKYAILMGGGDIFSQETNTDHTTAKLLDIDVEEPSAIKVNSTEAVDRLHLNSGDVMEEMPVDWHRSVSYASEIEQFIHTYP
uniref:SAM-dependent MTase TRM10-type domain-containing protein n=1 Tax=Heterorhabditis bacteriophora TaxID=37862 RepID=A0A1I7WIX5_HETBA